MSEVFSVRRAEQTDLPRIAALNSQIFTGNRDNIEAATEWVGCLFRSYPRGQYFVIDSVGKVAGYIYWEIHGGFLRSEPAVELEQIGIDPEHQGKRLAPQLIEQSTELVVDWVKKRNNRIESGITFLSGAMLLTSTPRRCTPASFPKLPAFAFSLATAPKTCFAAKPKSFAKSTNNHSRPSCHTIRRSFYSCHLD